MSIPFDIQAVPEGLVIHAMPEGLVIQAVPEGLIIINKKH